MRSNLVLLAPQMLRFSGDLFCGKDSPTVITRLNWNTIHCEPWHYREAHIKACHIMCELGTDAIKTFYTGERFAEVIEGSPIPVFALGAEK